MHEDRSGTDNNSERNDNVDGLLKCLLAVARLHGKAVQEQQIKRTYAAHAGSMNMLELLQAAGGLGLLAREIQAPAEKLELLPMPYIASLQGMKPVTVMGCREGVVQVYNPATGRVEGLETGRLRQLWGGSCVLFADRPELAESQGEGAGWFVRVLRGYIPQFAKVLFLSLLLQLLGLVSPFFTQVIIDDVLVHNSVSTLDIMVGGMGLVMVFRLLIDGFRSYIFTNIASRADARLSSGLFHHLIYLPVAFFNRWSSGEIVARLREVEQIRQFITGTAMTVLLDVVFTVIYMAVMFHYSVELSLIVLLAVPVYTMLNLVVVPIYRKRLNENFEANAANQAYIIETITGIEAVKHAAAEGLLEKRWGTLLTKYVRSNAAIANLVNVAGSLGGLYQQLFTLAILWYGAYLVMENSLSVGQLVAFQMLAGMVVSPVMRLFGTWQGFQQAKVSLEKLGDIMSSRAEASFNPNRTVLPKLQGHLCLEDVSFRYGTEGRLVLGHLSMDIRAGSCIGIVGPSGSGKSTITKLLQLLYAPESGRILVDGVDMAQMEPSWLRQQIGVVLQESFLFNGTIAENIAIARPEAGLEEIVEAARLSGAWDFIQEMPKGLETNVGERGSSLSGGQRQRIAIARALITRPRILILDEATSALDYRSERSIMQNLHLFAKGRTVIMIAHRLSTVMQCDKIYVIAGGELAEEGKHEELLARQGIYHSLWMQQQVRAVTL